MTEAKRDLSPFQASVTGHIHDTRGNVLYEVQVSSGSRAWIVEKRYSEFAAFANAIRKRSWARGGVPALPPKKWVNRKAETFLSSRQNGLNNFIDTMLRLDGASEDSDVRKWFGLCDGVPVYEEPIAPVLRSHEQARRHYNSFSSRYDTLAGNAERLYRTEGLSMLALQEGERVLEIGFGTGHTIVDMARRVGPSGKVYGIDISDKMLEITYERALHENVADVCVLTTANAIREIPFPDKSVHAIFSSFTLDLVDAKEIPDFFSHARRVLRPRGRICIVSLSKCGTTRMDRLYEWFHEKFPIAVDCRPIFVQKAMEDAGFKTRRLRIMHMWGLSVEVVVAEK